MTGGANKGILVAPGLDWDGWSSGHQGRGGFGQSPLQLSGFFLTKPASYGRSKIAAMIQYETIFMQRTVIDSPQQFNFETLVSAARSEL